MRAIAATNMLEPFFPRFDRQDEFLPEEEFPDLLSGNSMVPPEFDDGSLSSSIPSPPNTASNSERDAFITETARREMETTADFARFLPFDSLQEINDISHPVKDEYLDPALNTNLSRTNLDLLYHEWRDQDPAGDLRKFAYLIATALHETGGSFQSIHESLAPEQWEDPNIRAYAETGYWGRGFVQLKWEGSYRKIGEDIGLDLLTHPRLALLPTIATDIMGTGMFNTGFAKPYNLDQFFSGTTEDWMGARSILGRPDAEPVARLGRAIHKELKAYGEQKAAGLIGPELSMVDWLHGKEEFFGPARQMDQWRILHALGHYQFDRPTYKEASESQIQYLMDCDGAGYGWGMKTEDGKREMAARQAFQLASNARYPQAPALPAEGVNDAATASRLLQGGHQLAAGQDMIRFAFQQQLSPTDTLASILDRYQRSEFNLPQVVQQLMAYLPWPQGDTVTAFMDKLEGNRPTQLAQLITTSAQEQDLLPLLPPELIGRMYPLLLTGNPPLANALQPFL